MLKNGSTLAVSVPVNLSIKLDFISINDPRQSYFVYELRFMCRRILCLHEPRVQKNKRVHSCGPGGGMHACHAAGPGSIPGRDKFPGWFFFSGCFLTCKTNVVKI